MMNITKINETVEIIVKVKEPRKMFQFEMKMNISLFTSKTKEAAININNKGQLQIIYWFADISQLINRIDNEEGLDYLYNAIVVEAQYNEESVIKAFNLKERLLCV